MAVNQPELLVVYGGKTTRASYRDVVPNDPNFFLNPAYDIKMIMNKGQYDIIKPAWITDSIAKGELVPMRKKWVYLLLL